jgi:ElaA protein
MPDPTGHRYGRRPVTIHDSAFADLRPETLYEILRLRIDVFVVEQDCAFGDLDGRDREPTCRHLWIEEGGEVVGYLRILPPPCSTTRGPTEIGRVVTRPAARSTGVGARLMRAALLRIDGPSTVNAQSRLADWYGHFGFVVDGDEFLEDDIAHVPMRHEP